MVSGAGSLRSWPRKFLAWARSPSCRALPRVTNSPAAPLDSISRFQPVPIGLDERVVEERQVLVLHRQLADLVGLLVQGIAPRALDAVAHPGRPGRGAGRLHLGGGVRVLAAIEQ